MNYKSQEALSLLSDYMCDGMILYIENGIPPGGFLTAVLENDLMGAFSKADHINKGRLSEFCQYLYAYAPSNCHGSPEVVSTWIEKGGLEGA